MTKKQGRGSMRDVLKAKSEAKKTEHKKLSKPSGAMKGASASANTVRRVVSQAIKGNLTKKATVASRIKDSKKGEITKKFKKEHPGMAALASTLDKATKRGNVAGMQAVKDKAAAKRHPKNK